MSQYFNKSGTFRPDLLDRSPYLNRDLDKPEENNTTAEKKPKENSNSLDLAYQNWKKNPSPSTMGRVLERANPVIDQAITSYAGDKNPVIKGKARNIAVRSIKKYDPNSKASLRSWLNTNLQELQRASASASPLKMPERMKLENYRINRAEQEFNDTFGRKPEMEELADIVGLTPKRISNIRKANIQTLTEGQVTPESGDDEENPNTYLPGVPDNSAANTWAEYVYHDLDSTDKRIFNMYFGRGRYPKGMSVEQMAKELKMSPPAVSQRAKRISKKLESGLPAR